MYSLLRLVGWLGASVRKPVGREVSMGFREARAAASEFWKVTKWATITRSVESGG